MPRFSLRRLLLIVAWLAIVFAIYGSSVREREQFRERSIIYLEQEVAILKDTQESLSKLKPYRDVSVESAQIAKELAEAEKELAELRGER